VLLLVALTAAGPHLQRAAGTAWLALFPHSIQITVRPGDARLPAGQPLQIAASIEGRGARWLAAPPSLVVSADGEQHAVAMIPAGGTFEHTFDAVDRTFEYHVEAGSASSRAYTVEALRPPRVTRIDLHYSYPVFTRLPPRQEVDGGDIYGPAGTTVRLLVHTDKPIANGSMALGDGSLVALAPAGDTSVSADLMLVRDDGYRVRLVDTDGLGSRGDVEYFIRILSDRPPDVRLTRPSADQGITPLQEVVVEARADDDYGIASFDLVYTVAGREPRTVPFTGLTGTALARTGTYTLEAEALGVQPGDVITYYARARDVPRGRRSVETRTDIFFLEVKPFTEEFVSAESQAMGSGGSGTQIDSLIAAQKEIISATWNLERRSGAGRSAEDLEAVGRAQMELRSRAERMLVSGRRGIRGGLPPQQVQPTTPPGRIAGGADHVGAAVEAMGRAAEQLERQQTAGALPHEMAALQALLRAQAEVRRRQVLQQSAGAGGGGSSRSDRDLSNLFDRELQRQQRTTYETPPQAASAAEPAEGADVADRVRDLARRQEDLARQQRELANATVPAEEMKRQLARLTREQQEIRQQLDDLAKRQESAQGGGEGGGRSQSVREAAEAVRRAAEAMGRQQAEQAAVSGERAAEALRRAERQMRDAGPEARRRAASELQLDAQQIAAGQRRVTADAARQAADGDRARPAGTEARRRLSAEQDRLAERVDALAQAARNLVRDVPGPEGEPFADAVKHLAAEQIGRRMRAAAERMRSEASAPGETQPEADGQIARALDVLAEKLAGDSNGAVSQAAAELDRSRELRDRLDRLGQQVRDAEARVRDAAADASATGAQGPEGARGRGEGGGGSDQGGRDAAEEALARAREAYARELERTREALGRQHGGLAGSTPEHHEFSRSAPGTEAFKQDFSEWESLRKDLDLAIEHHDAAVIGRLRARTADDRFNAGASEAVPDEYRALVSRYFESLARVRK
jgi:hypothetical protein